MLGQQLHLLLFYLQYPPPVCLICCISRVSNNLCNFSIFSIPHLFASLGPNPFAWLQTSVWIDFATKSPPWKETKQPRKYTKKNEIQHRPPKTVTKAFQGTAFKRTAKQEPRTKIQGNKWHLSNGHKSLVLFCLIFEYPRAICTFGMHSGISYVCIVLIQKLLPKMRVKILLFVLEMQDQNSTVRFGGVTSWKYFSIFLGDTVCMYVCMYACR